MSSLIKTKGNRYLRLELQNRNADHVSFRQINQLGCVKGYISGVVSKAYSTFQHSLYRCLRKFILSEIQQNNDGDDSDNEPAQLPFFTRGNVAEKCSAIREGDIVVLEQPFVESTCNTRPVYHLAGDKNLSDISVWVIRKNNASLIVSRTDQGITDSSVNNQDESGKDSQDVDLLSEDMDVDLSNDEYQSPSISASSRNSTVSTSRHDKGEKRDLEIDPNQSQKGDQEHLCETQRVTRSGHAAYHSTDTFHKKTSTGSYMTLRSTHSSKERTKDIETHQNLDKSSTESHGKSLTTRRRSRPFTSPSYITTSPYKHRKTQSPKLPSPKHTSRSQALASSTDSSDDNVISQNLESVNKLGKFLTIPIKKLVLPPQVGQDDEDDEVILHFHAKGKTFPVRVPKAGIPQCILTSHHLPSTNTSDERIPPSSDDDDSQFSLAMDVEDKTGTDNNDSIEISSPSGTFSFNSSTESDSNIQTPKSAKSASVDPVDVTDDADPHTTSQQTTPSGTFQSKQQQKLTKSPQKSSHKGEGKAQQSSTQGLSPCQYINAPSTSHATMTTIQPSHNTQQTAAAHNAPGTLPTQNVQSNVTTKVSSDSTQNAPGPSDVNQSAFRQSYKVPNGYTKLSEIKVGTVANVYGVVKYFKPAWKSRGTDMCSVVVIADPSTDDKLECVMFDKNANVLPKVRRIGDIVRLHRVNIKRYKNQNQALSTRGFAAVVFDRNVTIPVSQDAARFSSSTISFNDNDRDVVKTLKEWRVSLPDFFSPAMVVTASEIEPGFYFDVVCQVKGVYKHKHLNDCLCLKVTDGTDPRYEIKNCDDDESFEQTVAFDATQCHSTIFDVYVYGTHAKLLLVYKVTNGSILFLHNVQSHCTHGPGAGLLDVIEPTVELCMHRGSEYGRGVSVLSQDSDDAKDLQQRLSNTLQTK